MYSVAKHLYIDNGELLGNDTLTFSIVGMLGVHYIEVQTHFIK